MKLNKMSDKNKIILRKYMINYIKISGDVKGTESYKKIYKREYNKINKKRRNIENKKRYKNDIMFSLKIKLRTMIYDSIEYKSKKTEDILGCTFEEFKIYLESKFENWMTWENRGLYNGDFDYGWDIDHIIPLSTAKTEEDVIKLNHYTNLQPLCSKLNRNVKKNQIF